MYNIEIKHLKLVKTISETGNLTRAATLLNISQPALSRQLKDIEEELGTILFERTKKRMIPTRVGETLNKTAGRILEELNRVEHEVVKTLHGDVGELKIGVHCVLCYKWLPEMLKKYMALYPRVDISLGNSKKMISDLKDKRYDLLISSFTFNHKDITHIPLFEDDVVVVMHPKHLLASRLFLTESDFNGENLISFAEESKDAFLQYCLLPAEIKLKSFFQVDQPEGIIELVKAGIGIALLPKWSVDKYLKKNELTGRPFSKQGFKLQWNVSFLKDANLSAFRQQFIKMFSEFTPVPAIKSPNHLLQE